MAYMVTYVFGNGLDLACGLNTRFCDMYQDYVKEPSDSEIIKTFKNDIEKDKTMHYQNWSDFEVGMAKYATKLDSEKSLKLCLSDFKKFMIKHLKGENERFIRQFKDKELKDKIISEFSKEIFGYKGDDLPPNERDIIKGFMNELTIENIISFNYTNIIHLLLTTEKYNYIDKIYQVHGTLNSEVIMGVDNESQIVDLPYELSKSGKRAFIKTLINSEFNQTKVNTIYRIIKRSDLIVIFGWALGQSDMSWKNLIREWLLNNTDHHIIYLKKKTNNTVISEAGELLDEIDSEREKFMDLMGIPEEKRMNVEQRIHIPINNKKFQIKLPDENKFELEESRIVNAKKFIKENIDKQIG